jgi:hypothetical protein
MSGLLIKCTYCGKLCRPVYDIDTKDYKDRSSHQCDYHGAVRVREFWSFDGSIHIKTVLIILYKDNRYQASIYYDNDPLAEKFRIDKYNSKLKTNEIIVTLDFHPDITPENIATKLPTYLLFL